MPITGDALQHMASREKFQMFAENLEVVMETHSLSESARARIEAIKLNAAAELLNGLAAFWSSIGLSIRALREHDASELIPLFEVYAERQFDSESRELLDVVPDGDAYTKDTILLPVNIALGICPKHFVIPRDALQTEWTGLFRTIRADMKQASANKSGGMFQGPCGDWENYLDHSFKRQWLKSGIIPGSDPGLNGLRLMFCLKYLWHLRFYANHQRFIARVCTHLSERSHIWRAEAYSRMAQRLSTKSNSSKPVLLPPPGDTQPVDSTRGGNVIAVDAPKKRGPRPDYETALRVAEIVAKVAPDRNWRSKLDDLCEALDDEGVPSPKTWRNQDRHCRGWMQYPERESAVKVIEYRLKTAAEKKTSPEILS
jgi:hypothetical protein